MKKFPLTFWRSLILVLLLLPAVMVWLKPPSGVQSKLDTIVHASDFAVTNANDDGPGSLRAAIINSNLNPSPNQSPNFVVFVIPGPGEQTIKLLSPLPVITSPLWINGANNALRVELDGSSAGPGANGLTINSSRCSVYSLLINRFDGAGISIIGGESATISSNRIGTDRSGTVDLGNKLAGIEIRNSNRNQISLNLISGNDRSGIEVRDGANNSIYSNIITGNALSGIFIGGAAAAANNINSNQVGVNNNVALGNQTGISIDSAASANIIANNSIAGNTGEGVLVEGNDNVIQNNQIGINTFDATVAIGNGHDGILIRNGARNLIGGIPFGVGNYLMWNAAHGIEVTGATAFGNKILNNHIGLDITHARPCPNGADGIRFRNGANSNVVGNPELGSYTENNIAFNHGAGVRVDIDAGTGNMIVGNAIRENDGLGIDLGPAGITPNDPGDVDNGGNGLQNFPSLTVARSATGGTFFTFNRGYIEGTLNSTPGSAFRLDFYNNLNCDSSGNGEGRSFLGSTTASTSADGNAVFSVSNLPFFPDALITATATDQNGSTSEFSPCISTQHAGTILFDNDDRPHFQAVKESAGNVIITLVRQGGAAGNVSVDYATVNETATAGADYVSASGTINFADGESSKSISIPIINDNLTEGFETFGVRLTNPTGGAGYGYLPLIVVIEDNATPSRNLYTLTSGNDLVKSTTAHPEVALASMHLNGETIFKIDFRPATGQLYGISQSGRLFIIDKNTGAMTQVGTAPIPSFTHYPVGFDFNPVTDRIRLLLADGRNLQFNPDTGLVTSTDGPLAFAASDSNAGQPPHISEIANSNNYSGATSTTTYALNVPNFFDTQLLTLGSVNGSPISPTTGQLFTIGGFSGVSFYGFDIVDDQAFTSGIYQEDNVTQGAPGLFRIDLATRVATRIGNAVSAGDVAIEPPQQLQFSAALYSVNENAGAATITVIRTGDRTGTISVNYSTGDHTALAGLDYSASSGTLVFADGESSKTFTVPLINDSQIEGVESINLILNGATSGVAVGPRQTATIALMDEAIEQGTNPIDNAEFFVRQHYADFLSRQPDTGGLTFWTNHITECFGDLPCTNDRRVGTSAAYFIENEFQQTGFFVYRVYQEALGRRPSFAEFTADRSQVVGGPNLENGKQAFTADFVQRPAFIQIYPASMDGPAFVDALINTASQASGLTDLPSRRAALITQYNQGTNQVDSRVRVVQTLADDSAFSNVLYNPAFVLMQYFGYLRRPPDQAGYNFWLDHLNNRNPNNYRAMVCAFITSQEYQRRFSTIITRSNLDCAQP